MMFDPASSSPGTNLYSGWNIARALLGCCTENQKNFGDGG